MIRTDRPRFPNRSVDTCALARRLLRDDVPNCRLSTLASRLRLPHRPSHRALADALATADLLHVLLERAAGFGVLGLDDLIALPTIAGHPQVAKLRLTDHLPRRPGVYLFRDAGGRTLYVGKATNLRTRVRSYFSSDERRKVGQLLRETKRIDHVVCASPLEAAVLEVRLIHRFEPRFNRQAKSWRAYAYLKLTSERFPRLSVVRSVRDDGATYLGPLPSSRAAKRVAEAIETAVPLRRCTARPGAVARAGPCAPAQLGVATCPCAGDITEAAYQGIVATVLRGLSGEPSLLLAPLEARMLALAAVERFEEAAEMRERASALAGALRRQRRLEGLRRAGRVLIEVPGRSGAELRSGRLVRSWAVDHRGVSADVALPMDLDLAAPDRLSSDIALPMDLDLAAPDRLSSDIALPMDLDPAAPDRLSSVVAPASEAVSTVALPPEHRGRQTWEALGPAEPPAEPPAETPVSLGPVTALSRALADELSCVAAWLEKEAAVLRLLHSDRGLVSPFPALPSFEPARR